MTIRHFLSTTVIAVLLFTPVQADVFNRIASFSTAENSEGGVEQETSAEIITTTPDGMTLVYSDSPLGAIGMIDITNPAAPKPKGSMPVGGEPTGVTVIGDTAFTGVNTSKSYTEPSGKLVAIDLGSGDVTASCDLAGQPDSVAAAADGAFIAVAIENERDEDLGDGGLPQLPGGTVQIVPVKDGAMDCGAIITANMTGLAFVAPEDPEPEFVDVNSQGQIAVTLQENNHIVILNADGSVESHFSAGAVNLENVDVAEEGALTFDGKQPARLREPDAVQWLDNDRLVIANEGDWNGGSRGFTIFSKDGEELFESGLALEYEAAMLGHYPEKRSGNKGVEPEGIEVGTFGDDRYLFVLLERSSLVGVYKDTGEAPEFVQALPSGVGPEGAVAIPSRGLFVTANEVDFIEDGGVRAHVMIYQLQDAEPAYPQIRSVMDGGRPIGWGALSGLAADPEVVGKLYAVSDSFYAMQPSIFEIDATQTPAVITRRITVTRNGAPAQLMDLEGVVADGEGGFWLASEGRTDRMIPHGLYHVDGDGEIKQSVAFPPELLAVEKRFGSEGVTKVGDTLWIAIQRQWKDDPKHSVKLLSYNIESKEWGAVQYPTEEPVEKGWVGLSEITAHGDWMYIVERDNQIGAAAAVKRLYRVAMADMKPAALDGKLPMVKKALMRDFLPDMAGLNGYIVDKIEGFAIDASGTGYAVTDNDGVDDSSGETLFFKAGEY
ncbi:MAG: esterase-like activity of phytase family protein [Rhodobacteraceae bacterium]|nr:esterase-like activity of phytase family protein [Paracoccaceae bacterium]